MKNVLCAFAATLTILAVPSAHAIDPAAVQVTQPSESNGCATQPAPTVGRALRRSGEAGPVRHAAQVAAGNMSRPHFHPNDRFFVVVSGTWWVGTGEKFDPETTVPARAGAT